jgi:hypothetical protein
MIKNTILIFIFLGCADNKNVFQYRQIQNESLLYIENVGSKNTIRNGAFGDIVILNLENRNKEFITRDKYFDYAPALNSLGDECFFISKRDITGTKKHDLSKKSELYSISLRNGNILRIELDGRMSSSYLQVKHNFAFYLDNQGYLKKYDSRNRKSVLIFDGKIQNPVLSRDRSYLVYQTKGFSYSNYSSIFIRNMKSNKLNTVSEKKGSLIPLDLLGDTLLCYYGLFSNNKLSTKLVLYSQSIGNKLLDFDVNINGNYTLVDACFGKNTDEIYFIASTNNTGEKTYSDIWKFFTQSKKILRITSDGKIKESLDYFLPDKR